VTIVINGDNIKSLHDFYQELEQFLHKGDCPWGSNLDSLDEIVMCKFNYTDDPGKDVTKIIWKNSHLSRKFLGEEETRKWMEERDIQENKKISSQTLFETIVEIFSRTDGPKLILS
jgi:RNAse (barnase) inhibitor barstar